MDALMVWVFIFGVLYILGAPIAGSILLGLLGAVIYLFIVLTR